MVIGIISSVPSHIQTIKDAIWSNYQFISVTEKDIVTAVGIGKLVNSDKTVLLTQLQKTYGNIFISGDAIWDEKTCHHLLSVLQGVLLVDTTPLSPDDLSPGHYWTYDGATEAMKWRKQLVITHETTFLDYLDFSVETLQRHIKSLIELVQRHDDKKEVVNVSMEDVIKRAMADLGIEPTVDTFVETDDTEPVTQFETSETVEKDIEENLKEEDVPVSLPEHPSEVVFNSPPIDVSTDKNTLKGVRSTDAPAIQFKDNSVYLKIRNGTIALLLPTNLQLPTQVIDEHEYSTLVFTAPDLGNVELQALRIQNNVYSKSQSTSRPATPPANTSDLQQLVAQKVQLDQAIKIARAAKEDATVAELRKQRRYVRQQINVIGGSTNVTT